jgi:hypothetical protein
VAPPDFISSIAPCSVEPIDSANALKIVGQGHPATHQNASGGAAAPQLRCHQAVGFGLTFLLKANKEFSPMKEKLFRRTLWTMMIISGLLGLIALGCSSSGNKGKLLSEISGVWNRSQGEGTVQIDLTGENKTLEVDGKSYVATIDKVNTDLLKVELKVQNGAAQPEMWSVQQVWDDNGENYRLVFDHDGQKENLAHKAG